MMYEIEEEKQSSHLFLPSITLALKELLLFLSWTEEEIHTTISLTAESKFTFFLLFQDHSANHYTI